MTARYRTIVCLGDSITSIEEGPSYVTYWQERCNRELGEGKVSIIPAGVNGNTASDGYARMEADVLSHHPDLVTVMFGHNEIYQGISPLRYRHDLELVIDAIRRQSTADIWLLSPNQVADPALAALYRPYLEILEEVAAKQRVPLIDVWAEFDGKDLDVLYTYQFDYDGLTGRDYIHPNELGHRIIADFLMYSLKESAA